LATAEDRLVLPDSWLEHVHPRRGGEVVRPFSPDLGARALFDRMVADWRGGLAGILAAASTPETIQAAAAAWRSALEPVTKSPKRHSLGLLAGAAQAQHRWEHTLPDRVHPSVPSRGSDSTVGVA
jgi:hypothetical protein